MSLPGRHKPIHKRIEIVRSFKMTRLMLEQIRAACDENDISFSQFIRESNQPITVPLQSTKTIPTSNEQKVLDSSASLVA